MDITQLVDKYGQDIANNLQIATEQVYEKLIWYTRVNGIYQFSETVVIVIWLVLESLIAYKIGKKKSEDTYYPSDIWGPVVLIGLVVFLVGVILIDLLFSAGAKILIPEYYLMDQIVSKLSS